MNDKFTEITHTSWGSRIGASLKGLLFGIVLVVVGICLLFWNEGRAIKTHKALVESQGLVVSIDAQETAPELDGKLVHLTGEATTDQILSDDLLPVSVQALKLQRYVQTYQWEEKTHTEEKKNMGGDTDTVTTYQYQKVWSDKQISSSVFEHPNGHENPDEWYYPSTTWSADQISIGQYQLSTKHKNAIANFQELPLPKEIVLPKDMNLQGKILYYSQNSREPQIGDQRIKYKFIPAQIYSVVGDVKGSELREHLTSNGRSITLLTEGAHTADAMFEQAKSGNAMLTWGLRLAGTMVLILAFNMIFKPLSVLADIAPLFGNIVEIGTGIVSFLLGLTLALIIISIAWIFYRPLLGLALLAISIGLVYLLKRKSKQATTILQAPQKTEASLTAGN